MFRNLLLCGVIGGAVMLSGCSSSSENVQAAYISPIAYKNYTCRQLHEEAARVSQEVAVLSGVQDKKATDDAVATGVAVVLFWPAAFLVDGDNHQTAELARMKGQFNALKEEARRKNCSIEFREAPAQPVKRRHIDEN